jgi:hypothetical protein
MSIITSVEAKKCWKDTASRSRTLQEDKNLPDPFQSNAEKFLLTPFRWLGLSSINVVSAYNFFNTIGIFILLSLIYCFLFLFSKNRMLALAGALFAIGGYVLTQNGTILSWIFHSGVIIFPSPNIFGRSTDPYTALVPFFGFFILTYLASRAKFERFSRATSRPYLLILGAGVLYGILFYDYFYAWTFASAFLATLFLTSLMWRKMHSAVATVAIGCIGVCFAIPMLLGFYHFFTSPLGAQITYFFLEVKSHAFIHSSTLLALMALFGIYWYLFPKDENISFIVAVIAAGWLALEQQIITGHVVQYAHYYWYFIVPLAIIFGTYMLVRIAEHYSNLLGRSLAIALIAIAFLNTGAQQAKAFYIMLPAKMHEQQYGPIIRTLQKLPYGVVFATNGGDSAAFLVTIYTNDDLYWIPAATDSDFPPQHYKEALLVYLYVNKESRANPTEYLKTALASSTTNSYVDMYEELEGYEHGIPLEKYLKVAPPHSDPQILSARATYLPLVGEHYRSVGDEKDILAALKARDVRYVMWDKRVNPEWDLSIFPLQLIATSTDVNLYSLQY